MIPAFQTFSALIDTGADYTCISPTVVSTIGLTPVGMEAVQSATGVTPMNYYLADLILPFGEAGFVFQATRVSEFAGSAGGPFQMLLGRDVLCEGVFTLNFDGSFTFSI